MTQSIMLDNLKAMQKPCTSSRGPGVSHWKETDKLEEAKARCGNYLYYENDCSLLFSKIPLEDLNMSNHVILISSHADFVPGIKKPFCKEEGPILHGTFDNSITNATLLNLMQDNRLPDNVILALTGDEETGRCFGAREVLQFLESREIDSTKVFPIALDVTYEGFGKSLRSLDKTGDILKVAYSLENIVGTDTDLIDIAELTPEYPYVCSPKYNFPKNLPRHRRASDYSMFDEGAAYRKLIGHGFSFCIPSGGSMHTQKGLYVDKDVYFQYNEALKQFSLNYSRYLYESESFRQNNVLRP